MNKCLSLDEKVAFIASCEYEYFFNKPNVVGVGLGYKTVNTFNTFNKCIKIFVSKKVQKNKLNPHELIPSFYKSIPTDVQETGIFISQGLDKRIRPVPGGYSIGPASEFEGGTMGCLVTDGTDVYVLSCNHVLAYGNKLKIGEPILEPDVASHGRYPGDVIANLSRYIPLKFKGIFSKPTNYVDCAIGKVTSRSMVSPRIALIGKMEGVETAELGAKIKKVGSVTALTSGRIIGINETVEVNSDGKKLIFKDQIVTTRMAATGDSGAILLNENNYAVGLLISGSHASTTYNKMSTILKELDVSLVTQ